MYKSNLFNLNIFFSFSSLFFSLLLFLSIFSPMHFSSKFSRTKHSLNVFQCMVILNSIKKPWYKPSPTHTKPLFVLCCSHYQLVCYFSYWISLGYVVLHILRYLQGTIFQGLLFSSASSLELRAYSIVDHASGPKDHKSTIGFYIIFGRFSYFLEEQETYYYFLIFHKS